MANSLDDTRFAGRRNVTRALQVCLFVVDTAGHVDSERELDHRLGRGGERRQRKSEDSEPLEFHRLHVPIILCHSITINCSLSVASDNNSEPVAVTATISLN